MSYTTAVMPLIHREGLLKLINDGIMNVPATFKSIVPNTINSRQAYEQIQTHAGLGLFQNFNEAEGVSYDSIVPRFTKTYTPILRSLGLKHTKQSAQKDLYSFIKTFAPMISESAVATRNLLACNVLNLGFSSTTMASPDGVALFSASHPIIQYGTTSSNYGTDSLSGLALESAIQTVRDTKTDRGLPKYYRGGFNLVVGPLNEGIAHRAVKSVGLQGTANNDTNTYVSSNIKEIIPDQMVGFNMSSAAYKWFLVPVSAQDNPLVEISVAAMSTDTDYDIDFQTTKFVASFETLYDCLGWRGLYGSNC